jgi:hypothetical protein
VFKPVLGPASRHRSRTLNILLEKPGFLEVEKKKVQDIEPKAKSLLFSTQ